METILKYFSLKRIFLPIDLSEATGIKSLNGKFLLSRRLSMTFPTTPVDPITATFILIYFFSFF